MKHVKKMMNLTQPVLGRNSGFQPFLVFSVVPRRCSMYVPWWLRLSETEFLRNSDYNLSHLSFDKFLKWRSCQEWFGGRKDQPDIGVSREKGSPDIGVSAEDSTQKFTVN
jgi:hypothetical protein